MVSSTALITATKSVTNDWTRQRKAEERRNRSRASRRNLYLAKPKTQKELICELLPAAYHKASGGGKLPASQRQVFYALRPVLLSRLGKEIDYKYFAQLLVRYLNDNHQTTKDWRISRDNRGALIEPHTGQTVAMGTLAVDGYLDGLDAKAPWGMPSCDDAFDRRFPTLGPANRYQALLYVEKEGFHPLFQAVQLAERYDIAIVSCKGQSVVAARELIDRLCSVDGGVPLLVLHDFDVYGFLICQSLTSVSARAREQGRVAYEFRNEINVTDLGLRLSDVETWDLDSEPCRYKEGLGEDCHATPEEREYLRAGQRVELNAFTSEQIIEWIESKLTTHGIREKLIPDDDVLEAAYRRSHHLQYLSQQMAKLADASWQSAQSLAIPDDLRQELQTRLQAKPSLCWDAVLADLVGEESQAADDA